MSACKGIAASGEEGAFSGERYRAVARDTWTYRMDQTPYGRARVQAPRFPDTKISATLLEFGEPLLLPLGKSPSLDEIRATWEFIVWVWNSHVMAMPCWHQPEFLEALKRVVYARITPCEVKEAYEELAARRRERFADDARGVGEWELIANREGGYNLRCDARVPRGFQTPSG
jgi:hypothetical protein